jgi:hypothetical protein
MRHESANGSPGAVGFLKVLATIAILGALNWGLIGFFNWNLVDAILGGGAVEETSGASRFIYALVGVAGLGALFLLPAKRADVTDRRPHTV